MRDWDQLCQEWHTAERNYLGASESFRRISSAHNYDRLIEASLALQSAHNNLNEYKEALTA
jgi:hypothetical protein